VQRKAPQGPLAATSKVWTHHEHARRQEVAHGAAGLLVALRPRNRTDFVVVQLQTPHDCLVRLLQLHGALAALDDARVDGLHLARNELQSRARPNKAWVGDVPHSQMRSPTLHVYCHTRAGAHSENTRTLDKPT
jgi:hypothetical protein